MRVSLRKKSKKGKAVCNKCQKAIKPGASYYTWHPKHRDWQKRHAECGRPKQSELCAGKMSGVYAALEGLEEDINTARASMDISGLADAISTAIDSINEVKDEYEGNIDNMPESLQNSPTADEMREKAEGLEGFVSELESAKDTVESVDDEPEITDDQINGDHDDDCAFAKEEAKVEAGELQETSAECDCGLDEAKQAHEEWTEAVENAISEVENAAGSLSI